MSRFLLALALLSFAGDVAALEIARLGAGRRTDVCTDITGDLYSGCSCSAETCGFGSTCTVTVPEVQYTNSATGITATIMESSDLTVDATLDVENLEAKISASITVPPLLTGDDATYTLSEQTVSAGTTEYIFIPGLSFGSSPPGAMGLVFKVTMSGTMSSITFSVELDMCLEVATLGAVPTTCSSDIGLTFDPADQIPLELFSISESFCSACSSTTGECEGSDSGSSGSDDDDDVCFSADSTVQLASGATKTMADLEVGDSILSADAAGKLSYSEVAVLPHGANSKTASFVKVTTESGKAVKATPTHLLVSCDGSLVEAKSASCLRTVNGAEAVTSIESFKANGIYTAVTQNNEFIVVDGVVASPFAVVHGLINQYYMIHRAVYAAFPSLMKLPVVTSANLFVGMATAFAVNALSASQK